MQTTPRTSILDLIKSRRSTRRYASTPVPDEDLNAVLEAARWAPSGDNYQPWKFLVIKDASTMERIVDLIPYKQMQAFLKKAPVLIGILVNEKRSSWAVIDGALCAQNLALEAWARGLGTCFSAWWPTAPAALVDQVKALLGIPPRWTILTFTPLGYPDPDPARAHLPPKRRPLEKLVAYERFAEPADEAGK
ncbi:MAG: nitroreductase family protein [Candidatus Lokiarchaeota archaeon]|nr:nitroreductase family protein [Candidatus Lokiarchaeota archaeon]